MTGTASQAVPNTARLTAASALQKLLPELVALRLHAKQALWDLTGPAVLPLDVLTDEIAADAHTWSDPVAERAMALDFTVDARPVTVAGKFPAGHVSDHEAIAEIVELIEALDKFRWMLRRADAVT